VGGGHLLPKWFIVIIKAAKKPWLYSQEQTHFVTATIMQPDYESAAELQQHPSAESCSRSQQSPNSRNMLISMLMDGYGDNDTQMFINHMCS
jgi:hypothetical protein